METLEEKIQRTLEDIPQLMAAGAKDPVQVKTVAAIKRLVDLYTCDPDFAAAYNEDAAGALAAYGLDVRLPVAQDLLGSRAKDPLVELDRLSLELKWFYSYNVEKLKWRCRAQNEECVPTNKAVKRWRQRQLNRCWGEFGKTNVVFIHVPMVFELSLGCSVGCPFCALSAEKLQKVYRGTAENLEFWRGTLRVCREFIGAAAGSGVCYFASEPLDNPEYELFAEIFREEFGRTPQITTAAPLRNPERTRRLLADNAAHQPPILHRFSVLTLDLFRKICAAFTQEELLYVELLPRYPEAGFIQLTRAGKLRGVPSDAAEEESYCNTISCASGFVINMAEKSIRLTAPTNASDEYPNGEIVIGKFYFETLDELRGLFQKIIAEQMPLSMDMARGWSLQKFYRWEETAEGVSLLGADNFVYQLKEAQEPKFYAEVCRLLAAGGHSGREIAALTADRTGASPANVLGLQRYLYNAGALVQQGAPPF